jgi:hypothetical protein
MAYKGCKGIFLMYVFNKFDMAKTQEKTYYFMGHRRYLLIDQPLKRNSLTFDGKQELECAPEVPSGYEILRQLKGMVFRDESAGKTLEPRISQRMTVRRKKKKKRKRKRNNKKKEPVADEKL